MDETLSSASTVVKTSGSSVGLWWLRIALCTTVAIAGFVGQIIYLDAAERVEREAADRLLLQAELIEDLPPGVLVPPGRAFHARWIMPDGTERRGPVSALDDARPGSTVEAWVHRATGAIVSAPMTRHDALTRTGGAVLLTMLSCASIIMLARRSVVRLTSRHQAQALDTDWQRVAPDWTNRYQ